MSKNNFLKEIPYTNGTGLKNGFDLNESWIQTYSGRRFNPTKPNFEAIVIQDIAHALSLQCRFSGHTKKFYSVAQHSVGVSNLCPEEDKLWGLLHDASEAYLVDIPNPLKRSGKFNSYLDFELEMMNAVCKRFNLPEKEPPSVKNADKIMLVAEADLLMSPLRSDWEIPLKLDKKDKVKIKPVSPKKAKIMFLEKFAELTGQERDIYSKYY